MPTTRPRHSITESDELTQALDHAAERWPGVPRSRLIVLLALDSDQRTRNDETRSQAVRLAAVRRHAGALTGTYPADHLQTMRDDWPE